ncbi:MAG TPA: DNA-processing protein DprA [Pyrinomonadaceae bacterium]|nr:DNA-processing protein DprA [Pyrinomonadaceae bacterium]
MTISLSPDTQALLLLTAPLIAGRTDTSSELLTAGEYQRLARFLIQIDRQPGDLLSPGREFSNDLKTIIDADRFARLVNRGFQLAQAVERWQARAIWLAGQTDEEYPKRLKQRLKESSPPIIYGCGDRAIIETGGLAVVGSRDVDSWLVDYTVAIGRETARAKRTLVSGGARGIDQAAMRGALEAGGNATGVLADSLERAALNREHRNLLMESKLALISPYDPSAGFNIGHAMQRNKLIYALADAALVVNSDYEKGGTWAGAVEQLDKLHFVPVYVRTEGETGQGLEALRRKGALPWPNPATPEAFVEALTVRTNGSGESSRSQQLSLLET